MPTVTLSEIAKKLGVSKTTVSRAFNNSPGARISETMRTRIIETCAKAGYQPNFMARALASSRTYVIGAVFINISSPEIGQLVEAAEHVARDHDYHLLLCSTRADVQREVRECAMLRQRGVEGLIIEHVVTRESSAEHLAAMQAAHYPIVLTGRCLDAPQIDYVGFDEIGGMALATQVLLDKGYRKIAYLGYHPDGSAWFPFIGDEVFLDLGGQGLVENRAVVGIGVSAGEGLQVSTSLVGRSYAMTGGEWHHGLLVTCAVLYTPKQDAVFELDGDAD